MTKAQKYRRQYYQQNKARLVERNNAWKAANAERYRLWRNEWARNNARVKRAEVRAVIREKKSAPCTDCGRKFPWYVMDFDHVRGKKVYNIGAMGNRLAVAKVLAEIAKCEVVCANCHRIRTFRRGWKGRKRTYA